MNKKKKDLIILFILGFLALFLIFLSFTVKDKNDDEKSPETETTTPTEKEKPTDENEINPNEGLEPPIESDDNINEVHPEEPKEEVDELDTLKQPLTGKQKYTSDTLRLSFDVPVEWADHVSMVEKDNFIQFYFKKEHLFLELSLIPETDWEMKKEFHRSLIIREGFRLIYFEALEHPLAESPDSEDYKLLSNIFKENGSLLKSVKFKD